MKELLILDKNILLFVQNYIRNPILDVIMQVITSLGNFGFIAILPCVLLIVSKRYRKEGFLAMAALIINAAITNLVLKNYVNRVRPFVTIPDLKLLTRIPVDSSFPSGHTAACFTVGTVFLLTLPKKYAIPYMIFACLMGISRIYVGVHYPSDVICGAIIGIVVAILTVQIAQGKRKRN